MKKKKLKERGAVKKELENVRKKKNVVRRELGEANLQDQDDVLELYRVTWYRYQK